MQKYAGASARGYERILKSSREIVAVGEALDAGEELDEQQAELEPTGAEDEDESGDGEADKDLTEDPEPAKASRKKPKRKKPKKNDAKKKKDQDSAAAGMRAAFELVRKRL